MRILIANDDGVYSPGIVALAEVATRFGEVRIVAPDVEQSSMGHAITANRPLNYQKARLKDFDAYRVNGTPADCVALGLHLWGGADLVLSGINLGLNLAVPSGIPELWRLPNKPSFREREVLLLVLQLSMRNQSSKNCNHMWSRYSKY